MDAIDKKILQELQSNAKQNTKEIATKVGLTVSPTFERIRKLEQQGYIKQYTALLDGEKIGKSITVFVQVSVLHHSKELVQSFREEINALPEIMECHQVSGNYDFLLKVAVNSMRDYQTLVIEKLSMLKGISNVQSSFVMQEIKYSTSFDLQ